jgi:hypothetical protein
MKGIFFALAVGAGIAMVPSLQASATPANDTAVVSAGQQVDTIVTAAVKKTKRCRADFKRDRAGYCVPNPHA